MWQATSEENLALKETEAFRSKIVAHVDEVVRDAREKARSRCQVALMLEGGRLSVIALSKLVVTD